MLSRCLNRTPNQLYRVGIRQIVNPVINSHSWQPLPAVLPFAYDKPSRELQGVLSQSKLDELDRMYNFQLQDDHEFNNPALIPQTSPLWGYIYGTQLIKFKIQLDNLSADEQFLRNYLNAHIDELTMRMKRYYPNLDWKSQYEFESSKKVSSHYSKAKVDALHEIINESPETYISLHKNNSFIKEYDPEDKFQDYLPKSLEEKLIKWYEFEWGINSKGKFENFFEEVHKLEHSIAIRVDSFSKEFRQEFNEFLRHYANDFDCLKNLIDAIDLAAPSITGGNIDNLNSEELISKCLEIMELKSGKITKQGSDIIGLLFLGNNQSSKNFNGKDISEMSSVLSNVSKDRLRTIYKGLSIQDYLKHGSASRVIFASLLRHYPQWFGQFFADPNSLDTFILSNEKHMDQIAENQKNYYQAQINVVNGLSNFIEGISSIIGDQRENLDFTIKKILLKNIKQANGDKHSDWIINTLQDKINACKGSNDISGRIKYTTILKYLQNSNLYWYNFLKFISCPCRNNYSGDLIRGIIIASNQNSTSFYDGLVEDIVGYLKEQGLSTSRSSSIKSDVSSKLDAAWKEFKNITKEAFSVQKQYEDSWKTLKLDYSDGIDFEHIRDTYNPLDIHLSQQRYLTPY